MSNLQITQAPAAHTAMLIRKPVAEVFEAFIDPAITTKFWFTKSSGRLEPGKEVQWTWEMYDVSTQVSVKAIEENKRILAEWAGYNNPTLIEWTFTPHGDNATFVNITETGFSGNGDELFTQVVDSTGGFSWVLAGLKALLEHNVTLNLVGDRHPTQTIA
ncbi:polyketide cyclase [Ktedonosporobacter rubrisoli]|uniref:Polyketide cyclase n=1 Tax=Ktedonosporobacter rubrisoli TaxID=2509675 RepID=A0A4P6JKG4_KTERU|nr:SRPBCC family protein [Ktedonosporobacter rubrisoli]QBD75649.1 polyketide cyclase [Ktedonosporobacter rubrisoli]